MQCAHRPTHPTVSVGFPLGRHVESKSRWCSVELHHEILDSICSVAIQSNKKLRQWSINVQAYLLDHDGLKFGWVMASDWPCMKIYS